MGHPSINIMATLNLYYPVTPVYVNQGFGVNGDYYQSHGISIIGHNGIDFAAKHGEPVYASHDGEAWYEIDASQGHGVIIRTTDKFDYEGSEVLFKSLYWHLVDSSKEPQFKSPIEDHMDLSLPGKPVKAGDLIGYADTTGFSTGDHLHFGLKPVAQNETSGDYYNPAQQNGYLGAINPITYFNGLNAADLNTPIAKHTFYIPLKYGDTGSEVLALQRCLISLGYPCSQNGIYDSQTAAEIFEFQKKYAITNVWSFISIWTSMGRRVGTYTIPTLNRLFA